MSTSPLHAYRLVVEYPEGVNDTNPPATWGRSQIADDEYDTFQWPRVHPYLSRSGAKKRADLLRSYGCTVTIEKSDPITWPA